MIIKSDQRDWLYSCFKNLGFGVIAFGIVTLFCALGLHAEPAISRDEEVERLLSIVRDPSFLSQDPDTLAKAIGGLGELKATEAIDDLIKLLTFNHAYDGEKLAGGRLNAQPVTVFERYPAIVALFAIGKPALPALIKVIETYESDSLEAKNAGLAVELIFRDDPSQGVKYLEEAATKAQTIQAAERLFAAARRKPVLPRK